MFQDKNSNIMTQQYYVSAFLLVYLMTFLQMHRLHHRSQDSSVSIVTGPCAGQETNQGLTPGREKRFFFFVMHPNQLGGPSILLTNGPKGLFLPQEWWLGYQTGHSSPSSIKVMNTWSHMSILPHFMPWCSIRHMNSFICHLQNVKSEC
jgi:hypothetical protein